MALREPDTLLDRVNKRALTLNRLRAEALVEMVPRPPGQRKLSEAEQMANYEAMTPQDIAQMVAKRGQAETEHYIAIMERRRRAERRGQG